MELSAGAHFSESRRSMIYRRQKTRGRFRNIYVPSDEYRLKLAPCKVELKSLLDEHLDRCADHAFIKGRNCITNALEHVGKRFVLTLDIENFFDSITDKLLVGRLAPDLMRLVLEDGAPRQGLPTSPLVANVAMIEIDCRLRKLCDALGEISFSRYADDITIGFQAVELRGAIQQGVEAILSSYGFVLNTRKTRLQNARNGLVHITGVAIDGKGVRPTRHTRRRIRAAMHQRNKPQCLGLIEWAQCKLPRITPQDE